MIPIGDTPRAHLTPWVNYALIAINIAVFLYTLSLAVGGDDTAQAVADQRTNCYGLEIPSSQLDSFYCRWAFQPREFIDVATNDVDPAIDGINRTEVLLSLVASIFIHGGWLHILGNMLFLWVFGDNIESRFGHLRYLGFYLLGGILASFAQAAMDVDSLVPIVGASGAVSAVLGAYIVYFPGASVRVLVPIWVVLFPFQVPAFLMIGLWFAQNLFAGVAELGAETAAGSGIAFFAHIGGFVFGAVIALIFGGSNEGPPSKRDPVPLRMDSAVTEVIRRGSRRM